MRFKLQILSALPLILLLLACVAFVVAMTLHLESPRVLAVGFLVVACVAGVFLFRAFEHGAPNGQVAVAPRPDRVKVRRQMLWAKVSIAVLSTLLVIGWLPAFHGAPITPLIVGTLFDVALIAGEVHRLKSFKKA